jgi:hypothetical protein
MIDDAQLVQRLLQAGLVDEPTIKEGFRRRGDSKTSLYEVFIHERLIEESTLVQLAATILNVPSVSLDNVILASDLIDLVPLSIANRNQVIPLRVAEEGGRLELILGMADPLDMLAMDEISTHTGIDIHPVLVGPISLAAAIKRNYSIAEIDDLVDLGDVALDDLEDASWAEFFDSAEAMGEIEDSSVISQSMRDRPTTDVFEIADNGDDLPSLDLLERDLMQAPVNAQPTSLESWDLDDAITGAKAEPDPVTQKRAQKSSEIVSAANANSLFDDAATSRRAQIEAHSRALLDEDEFDVGEPTMQKSLDELSNSEEGETGRTSRGIGSDGQGKGGLASVRPSAKVHPNADDTDSLDSGQLDTGSNRTSVGVGVQEMSSRRKSRESETDYGFLGRQILKTKTDDPDEAEGEASAPEPKPKVVEVEPATRKVEVDLDFENDVASGDTLKGLGAVVPRPTAKVDPNTRELTESDLADLHETEDELSRKPTNQFRALGREKPGVQSRPLNALEIPEGVDARSALQALIELLVDRGVLSELEIQALLDALRT